MATAKRVFKKKTGEDNGVLLHLTNTEAEVLNVVLGYVAGDPTNSPRKYSQRIRDELTRIGVAWDMGHYAVTSYANIGFKDYPPRPKKAKQDIGQETQKAVAKGTSVSPSEAPRGLKVGDRVRIKGQFNHPIISWNPAMGSTVGKLGMVKKRWDPAAHGHDGLWVAVDGGNAWTYPDSALELVQKETTEAPDLSLRVGARVELTEDYIHWKTGTRGTVTALDAAAVPRHWGEKYLAYVRADGESEPQGVYDIRFKVIG